MALQVDMTMEVLWLGVIQLKMKEIRINQFQQSLNYMKVKKLEFILGTHAHSDHIGGVPAIAYYYVDSNTKYYYREYRKTREDTTQVDWANYKYYLAAVKSMQKKSAQ